MKRVLLIGSLLAIMLLVGGCAISDYLTGDASNKSYSLLTEEEDVEDEDLDELEELIDELEEEIGEEAEEAVVEEEIDDDSFLKITVKESDLVRLKPKATDADEDTLTYKFSEPLNADGEWQTDYGDAGNYLITVTASDGDLATTKKVLLAVERVNVAPIIENLSDSIVLDEGDTLTIDPEVSDPNGDLVELTISEPVGNDGVWEIDYQENGEYEVTITASDGELETIDTIKLTVNKKNVPPTIEEIEDIEIEEGETVTIEPVVSDLNGDKVSVTISEPVNNDGEWVTGFTDNGVYKVTIKATDGPSTATKVVTVTVKDVNKAPEILDIELE
jgi:hypothetical protein